MLLVFFLSSQLKELLCDVEGPQNGHPSDTLVIKHVREAHGGRNRLMHFAVDEFGKLQGHFRISVAPDLQGLTEDGHLHLCFLFAHGHPSYAAAAFSASSLEPPEAFQSPTPAVSRSQED